MKSWAHGKLLDGQNPKPFNMTASFYDPWHGVILGNSIYLYIFLGKRMYNLEPAVLNIYYTLHRDEGYLFSYRGSSLGPRAIDPKMMVA